MQSRLFARMSFLLSLASAIPMQSFVHEKDPVVHTAQGHILGKRISGAELFAGIPFAVPVVGENRFARAKMSKRPFENNVFDARRFGAPCIQNPLGDPRPPHDTLTPAPSEDCLNLNVYRPANATNAPVVLSPNPVTSDDLTPVGSSCGPLGEVFVADMPATVTSMAPNSPSGPRASPTQPLLSSTPKPILLGRHGVIVVAVSYRVGALGFLPVQAQP